MARYMYSRSSFLLKLNRLHSWLLAIVTVCFLCPKGICASDNYYGIGFEGNSFLKKYFDNEIIRQVIVVVPTELSKAHLYLFVKDKSAWKQQMACSAFLGKAGIGKQKEGDMKTPTGDYTFTMAFGIKPNPGCKISYTELSDTMYWCGDREYYNTFVDITKVKHRCKGEHLINYSKQYAYVLALDYNKDCAWKKGSGIFLHCNGDNPYTAGCIAIPEKEMKTILTHVDANAHILICKQKVK